MKYLIIALILASCGQPPASLQGPDADYSDPGLPGEDKLEKDPDPGDLTIIPHGFAFCFHDNLYINTNIGTRYLPPGKYRPKLNGKRCRFRVAEGCKIVEEDR